MDNKEPIMISALNHYLYCPRRCALIHVEQTFQENIYTMRGKEVHEHADEASSHLEAGVRVERALPIWSKRLNLVGKADVVEFHGDIPYPVEYKSGRHKEFENDYLQLCAQAVCLEEMFNVTIDKGALYWHGSRERKEIVLTDALKVQVQEVAEAVNKMMAVRKMPSPVNDGRCADCSLRESCMPEVVDDKSRCRKVAEGLFEVDLK
jgi:CRISPR-associated exonuclease Cas4